MKSRWLKNILIIAGLGLLVYHSIYFKKLDEYKVSHTTKVFDASAYAAGFWKDKLIPNLDKAIDLPQLLELLAVDPGKSFSEHSHALGIGNLRYFLVKGSGLIDSVLEDRVRITLRQAPGAPGISLATEFIFGNAVRDATGLININEFTNTMDFNAVSDGLNRIIREQVVAPVKPNLMAGKAISFTGALELNQEHYDSSALEVIPVQINILNKGATDQ